MSQINQNTACALAAVCGLIAPPSAAAAKSYQYNVDVFDREIAVPATAPTGQILARQLLSPDQLCNADQCDISSVTLYPYGNHASFDVSTIPTTARGVNTQLLINGVPRTSGDYSYLNGVSSPIEVRLVAAGGGVTSHSLNSQGATVAYFKVYAKNPLSGDSYWVYIYSSGRITAIKGTCAVTTPPVTLPPLTTAGLPPPGATAGGATFNMKVERCPAGYNRVGYSLSQPTASPLPQPGVLQNNTDSTARGVRIRLEDTKGSPLRLNESYPVNEYSKANGGSYAIPLRAVYYRTTAVASPGTVKADVTVSLDYQ